MIKYSSLVIVFAGLLLSGCEGLSQLTRNPPPAPPQPTSETTADPSVTAAPTIDVAPETLAALPDVDDDPDQFIGATGQDLATALGDPGLVRKEGPAEIWQYRGDNCILDLFLYTPETNAAAQPRVEYVELRNPGLSESQRRACLARMLQDRLIPTS